MNQVILIIQRLQQWLSAAWYNEENNTTTHQTKNTSSIIELHFYLTFYLLDHFLQPKDKNTQHKLKISHLIVYSFSSLISSYFQSDIHSLLEAMEPRNCFCQSWREKSEHHAFAHPNNNWKPFSFQPEVLEGAGHRSCFRDTVD